LKFRAQKPLGDDLGFILGLSWSRIESFGGVLDRFGCHVGVALGHLGAVPWTVPLAQLKLWLKVPPQGPFRGDLGIILGLSWGRRGPSDAIWGCLEAIWGPCWNRCSPSWSRPLDDAKLRWKVPAQKPFRDDLGFILGLSRSRLAPFRVS
jgi:hypothetical protein